MKKLLALMTSVLLACSVMTACSDKAKEDDDDKDSSSSSSVQDSSSSVADSSSEADSSDSDTTASDDSSDASSEDDPQQPAGDTDAGTPLGETVGDAVDVDLAPFEVLDKINNSDSMTLDAMIEMDMDGTAVSYPIYMTTDGNNTYAKVSFLGMFEIEALTLDGKSYILDSTNKKYFLNSSAEETETDADSLIDEMDLNDLSPDFDESNVKSCNKVTIDGEEYVRYVIEIDDETVYAYAQDGVLKCCAGYDPDEGNLKITFNEASDKAHSELLKLPDGYTEMTEDEYADMLSGGF